MANTQMYDARHITGDPRYQPQMTQWFRVSIEGISKELTLTVQTLNLPERSNQPVEVPFGNTTAKIAGKTEYAEGSLSFFDAIRLDIVTQLQEWQDTIYDPATGKQGWVENYKRTMYVTTYGPDGTYERKWKYEGVWPSSVNAGELSHESSDKVMCQVTLQYDRAYRVSSKK